MRRPEDDEVEEETRLMGVAVDGMGGSRPGRGGGGIMDGPKDGAAMEGAGPRTVGFRGGAGWELGAGGALSSEKVGTGRDGGSETAVALGVVCSSGSAMVGGGGCETIFGSGGGGIEAVSCLAG